MTSPFNERAALDELERFREEIERERARRRSVSDQFESFIRSFKPQAPADLSIPAEQQPGEPPVPPVPPPGIAVQTLPPSAPAKAAPPPIQPPSPAPGASEPPRIELPPAASPTPSSRVEPREVAAPSVLESSTRPRRRPAVALGLLGLLVLGVIAWMLWRPNASPPVTTTELAPATEPGAVPGAPASSATAEQATEPPAGQSGPPAPAAASAATELTTIRNVWVRVIVDGERVLERELPAGARIPLTPTRTIVIRTGDADAVRLTIAGTDQGSFGREGQVVTRTFTVTQEK